MMITLFRQIGKLYADPIASIDFWSCLFEGFPYQGCELKKMEPWLTLIML